MYLDGAAIDGLSIHASARHQHFFVFRPLQF
jgi:hypothetical protein